MRLYRAKIPEIAKEIIHSLCADGDIEVSLENREEAEADLVAIMDEYRRRDFELRNRVKDQMERDKLTYDQFGRVRKKLAEGERHPLGGDVERFLARQFLENMMISRFVDEVYAEDRVIYKKIMGFIQGHDVNEQEIREEAQDKVKNLKEGTVDYEIALQKAVREVKRRRGLI